MHLFALHLPKYMYKCLPMFIIGFSFIHVDLSTNVDIFVRLLRKMTPSPSYGLSLYEAQRQNT